MSEAIETDQPPLPPTTPENGEYDAARISNPIQDRPGVELKGGFLDVTIHKWYGGFYDFSKRIYQSGQTSST